MRPIEGEYTINGASLVDIFASAETGDAGEVSLSKTQKLNWTFLKDINFSPMGEPINGYVRITGRVPNLQNSDNEPNPYGFILVCRRLPEGGDSILLWIDAISPTEAATAHLKTVNYDSYGRLRSEGSYRYARTTNYGWGQLDINTQVKDADSIFPLMADLPEDIDVNATAREIIGLIMNDRDKSNEPLPEAINFGSLLVPADKTQAVATTPS